MAQVRLQRPGVGALVRQRVARSMANAKIEFERVLGVEDIARLERGQVYPSANPHPPDNEFRID